MLFISTVLDGFKVQFVIALIVTIAASFFEALSLASIVPLISAVVGGDQH